MKTHQLEHDLLDIHIATEPFLRVAHISLKGKPNLLKWETANPYEGLRTAYMEPHQLPESFDPAKQRVVEADISARSAAIYAQVDGETKLQNCMEISTTEDELFIRHGMMNHDNKTREIALWPIMVVPFGGMGCAPFGPEHPKDGQPIRKFVFWNTVPFNSPSIEVTNTHAALHYSKITEEFVKFGIHSTLSTAYYANNGQVLISRTAYDSDIMYPEGNGNVTFYGNPESKFAELEHVGPLQTVEPGETLWLDQRIQVRAIDNKELKADNATEWA